MVKKEKVDDEKEFVATIMAFYTKYTKKRLHRIRQMGTWLT